MTRVKKRYIGFCIALLLAIPCGYLVWLFSEAGKVRWAVELVGGEGGLSASASPLLQEDVLYLKALQLDPDKPLYEQVRALSVCREISYFCLTNNLTIANFLLLNTPDVTAAKNIVEGYGRYDILSAQPCPAKYETSVVIKEVQIISTLPEAEAQKLAQERLSKIEADGGLVFSLRTPACHRYFSAYPDIARGYLAHLALLVRAAQGQHSTAWVYLLSRPGVYLIIKKTGA